MKNNENLNRFHINSKEKRNRSFSFAYVKYIFKKDWKEIRGNREIFWPIILLPIIFSVFMPLLLGIGAVIAPEEYLPGASSYDVIEIFVINMMLKPMFLMIPVIVSMIIAADSFAGEKERKTTESLLVLPITHRELYLGKVMAAFLPAILFAVISFILMGIIVNVMVVSDIILGRNLLIFGDPSFWLIAFVLGTLFSLVNIQAGIMISSRSKTMKSAQSISGSLIVPVLGLLFGGIFQPQLLRNIGFLLILCGFFAVLVYIMTLLGSRIINREKLIANIG